MNIKVLGSGCSKCKKLYDATNEAVKELSLEASVEKVEDIMEIMKYNVMATPALVVEDEVLISGQLPSIAKIKELLTGK